MSIQVTERLIAVLMCFQSSFDARGGSLALFTSGGGIESLILVFANSESAGNAHTLL